MLCPSAGQWEPTQSTSRPVSIGLAFRDGTTAPLSLVGLRTSATMLVNCVGGAWGSTQRVAQGARIQSHASQQHGAAQPPQRQAAWRRQQQWQRRRGPAVCSASDEGE